MNRCGRTWEPRFSLAPIFFTLMEYMKKLIGLFLILSALTAKIEAQPNNYYFGLAGGMNYMRYHHNDIKYRLKPGFIGLVDAGLSLCYGFRFEGELSYRYNKVRNLKFEDFGGFVLKNNGRVQQWALLGNLIYDFTFFDYITPFVGMGAGYAIQQVGLSDQDFDFEHDKRGFAWQAIGGVSVRLCPRIIMNFQYRYFRGPRDNMWSQAGLVGFNFLLN